MQGGPNACILQVALLPSALAADGSGAAAKVEAQGGNRAKMALREGTATFKNVQLEAEAPSAYVLRAKSASRKARPHAASFLGWLFAMPSFLSPVSFQAVLMCGCLAQGARHSDRRQTTPQSGCICN